MIEWAKEKVRAVFNGIKKKPKFLCYIGKFLCYIGIGIAVILAIRSFELITWFKNNIQISKEVKITDIVSAIASFVVFFFGYQISKAQKNISEAQKNIAKEKLKLDLFEKRYKIYTVFQSALTALIRGDLYDQPFYGAKGESNSKFDAYFTIRPCWYESKFLFDQSISKKLEEMFENIITLHREMTENIDICKRMHPNYNEQEIRDKMFQGEKVDNLICKISEHNSALPEIFAPYIFFEDLKIK